MKKKIFSIVFVLVSMFGTALIFSNPEQKVDADYTYFNPEVEHPEDPCDTGGISVCYGNS